MTSRLKTTTTIRPSQLVGSTSIWILSSFKEKDKPIFKEKKPIFKEKKPIFKEKKPILKEKKPIFKEKKTSSNTAR